MIALVEAMERAAWERYTDATCRAATLAGTQPELFDTAQQERVEWLGIATACTAECIRLESINHGR